MAKATAAKIAERDQLVLEHLKLAKAVAVRIHENLPVHVDLDDLIHSGMIGLIDAATKFDPRKQVAFSSYAKHRIKGAMLDSLRQLDWASRDTRHRHKQVQAVVTELAAALDRVPSDQEIAEKMGIEVERFSRMMIDVRSSIGLISASTRGEQHDELPDPDFACPAALRPDEMYRSNELSQALVEKLDTLPPRYRRIMELYYFRELTMKEIGEIFGIKESRISQIHKEALEKLRSKFESAGVTSARAFGAAA
jgi:RNA polymerase sigma factor for flagellar operon FliA